MRILSLIIICILLLTSCKKSTEHDVRFDSNRVEVYFRDFLTESFAPWSDKELIRLAPVRLVLKNPQEISELILSLPNQCINDSNPSPKLNLYLLINYYNNDKLLATDRFGAAEYKLSSGNASCLLSPEKSESIATKISALQLQIVNKEQNKEVK